MILAVDVGSSSARASAYDESGRALDDLFHRVPYEPTVDRDGAVERDPHRLLDAVAECVDAVHARGRGIRAVGVTTFWHGLLGFDRDGRPVTPVYMWSDTRSAADARLLRSALDEAALHARTGSYLHPSSTPTPEPSGHAFVPDPARHARYTEALQRQRDLEDTIPPA